MDAHKEIAFEEEICAHLAAHGWLYAKGDAAQYDRARALFPADVCDWVRETSPKAWEALCANHGGTAETLLLDRIRGELDARGTLDVLRRGIQMVGVRDTLKLAQFKPALAMNGDLVARYNANRLRVVRQVRYSLHNENAIDLVLFLNGIAVATVELKTDFTQSIQDAVDQYCLDRNPRPKGQTAEPLLEFLRGALVHFAVSNSEVQMTTKLAGADTFFLPFNKGNMGGKGNPPNPNGHPTAYLWEDVWARDSWLEILGRYLVTKRDKKKKITGIIFPRYHQLDVTRQLVATVLAEGAGQRYLIQHSAGSGKTNSIAWTAHFLADLHDADNHKVFDSVVVVSDRTVLDEQLQEAIFDFERTTGVVATITGEHTSKSKELAEAFSGSKKIVVSTIQTFPFALQKVQELAATEGKRFAVIADEAHSSQTGTAAAKLKQVLSVEEQKELEETGEIDSETILAAQMAARAHAPGITYVAFTATPKAKTLELFGRKDTPDSLPRPFHVYTMRQAIEEGFILDVLRNYTPYKLAFKLATGGKEWDELEVVRSEAMKGVMRWVHLHPYNISQKVKVVVEHFHETVAPLLGGKAKAMVVLSSRAEAVRWKIAIDKYIKETHYNYGTLVAFSGTVNDEDLGEVSENSQRLNPVPKKGKSHIEKIDIRTTFAGDDYKVLLVANKFQTGFDQPLLCGMYVDKKLAGIQAVQTLSRLNRAHKGKTDTYVLDFVNEPAEILAAFKPYYETAELEAVTDPNIVYNLYNKLDSSGHYDETEIERVVQVELSPKATNGQLQAALGPVADKLLRSYRTAKEAKRAAQEAHDATAEQEASDEMNALLLFKSDMMTFQRLYAFLSQIFDYGNTAIEKRAMFFRRLIPLLVFGREREGVDLSKIVLTHHNLRNQGQRSISLNNGGEKKIPPASGAGTGAIQEKQRALLAEIIAKVNDLFDGELTDDDKLIYVNNVLKGKLLESETLVQQAANNSKEQFANSPDLTSEFNNAIMDALAAHTTMSKQALGSEDVRKGLLEILLGPAQLWEALREKANMEPA